MISVAALVMQSYLGPVLVTAPSNVAVDNFAERIDRLSRKITARNNNGLEHNHAQWTRIRTVIRVYKYNEEMVAFRNLLRKPYLVDNIIRRRQNGWGSPPKWRLKLSLAYWLLTVCGATSVTGIEPLWPEHSEALHQMRKKMQEKWEHRPILKLASGRARWSAASRFLQDSIISQLFDELVKIADFVAMTPAASDNGGRTGLFGWKHNHARGVVVDEAANMNRADLACVWGNVLLPCFLAGDPKQLPPTIMTSEHERDTMGNLRNRLASDGEISPLLFLQASGIPVFRMHVQLRIARGLFDIVAREVYTRVPFSYAEVCNISGPRFEPGRLLEDFIRHNHPEVKPPPANKFSPFFLHCAGSSVVVSSSGSKRSSDQVRIALQFIAELVHTKSISASRVAMIATYTANVDLIERLRAKEKKEFEILADMPRAYTVDGFQGQENDIVVVVMGTTRRTGSGFTGDEQRLNVLMTRARAGLVIVGDVTTLHGRPARRGEKKDRFLRNLYCELDRTGRVATVKPREAGSA